MCRWPRPSEIKKLSNSYGKSFTYYRGTMYLSNASTQAYSKFVGPLGKNFTDLTKRFGLLYIWIKKSANSKELYVYATTKQAVSKAMIEIASRLSAYGIREESKITIKQYNNKKLELP